MDAEQPSLIEQIDAFLAHHAMKPTTFGRLALRDPKFVGQVREGRRTWPDTIAKARLFMKEYVPSHSGADTVGADVPATGKGEEVSAQAEAA